MERVRIVLFDFLLALGVMFCPVTAYAADGFLGGLEDIMGTREVATVDVEREYIDEYTPQEVVLEDSSESALPDDATTVDYVNETLNSFNQVQYGQRQRDLMQMLIMFFGGNDTNLGNEMRVVFVAVTVGLVFMWWGVRKSIRMIFASFRKGSASV